MGVMGCVCLMCFLYVSVDVSCLFFVSCFDVEHLFDVTLMPFPLVLGVVLSFLRCCKSFGVFTCILVSAFVDIV